MHDPTIVWNDRRTRLRRVAWDARLSGRVEHELLALTVRRVEQGLADGSLTRFVVPVALYRSQGPHVDTLVIGPTLEEVRELERAAAARARLREDAVVGAAVLGLDVEVDPGEVEAAWARTARAGRAPVAAPAEGLARLSAATAEVARAEAARLAVVVELVGGESSGSSSTERHTVHEVAIATGLSLHAAEALVDRARLLHGPMACFGAALAAGEVSFGHCLALIGQCRTITDDAVVTTIAEHALGFAQRMVVSDFRTQVVALIAELDPDAQARARTATARRTVYKRRDTDGMSFLGVLHQTSVINALYRQIVEDGSLLLDARRTDAAAAEAAAAAQQAPGSGAPGTPTPDVDPEAAARGAALTDGDLAPDACRADALAARVLGRRGQDGSITWDPAATAQVTLEVVIDRDTLDGLADRVVLVDGEPMPAAVGRELAYLARWFRRVIVDPVDGHLLDYGDRTYLPDPVRRFSFARDRGCRAPNCTRKHTRFLQLDHADEHPHGPSSTANCGALCTRCHQQKTARLLDIHDSRADGSATFTTPWGQRVHVPARPYLPRTTPTPARAADPAVPTPDQPDTPPF